MQNGTDSAMVLDALVQSMTAEGGGATLDSALREAARGGEAALGQALREALAGTSSRGALAALDLLIDRLDIAPNGATLGERRCGCGNGEIDSGVGEDDLVTMSLLYSDSGGEPGEGEYVDENGNGRYDEGETILVTGEKPKTMDEDDDLGSLPTTGGDGGNDGGGDGPGGGEVIGEEIEELDCRDRNALEAKSEIRNDSNSGYKEHGSVVYVDATGTVRHSPPIEGNSDGEIPVTAIRSWMTANGVTFGQVIGFVHNHDPYHYPDTTSLNSYPSGGDVPGGDWNVADWFVNNGAGGSGGQNFALYVIDPGWQMREFPYADKEFYKDLNQDQREAGTGLPDPLVSDGSSC